MKKVLGFGAALVDMLAKVDDSWIQKSGFAKGDMRMVDYPVLKSFLDRVENPQTVPGGSAGNTMVGVAKLGGKSAFVSKIGQDALGELFENHLRKAGVESRLLKSPVATGTVLSVVTPDAERTMFTYLGASNDFTLADVTEKLFDGVDYFYVEGYRAYDEACFEGAIRSAHKLGLKTVLDFGSFGTVNDCRKTFERLMADRMIDIVIANEEEAKAVTGVAEDEALAKLAETSEIAVVKIGKRGALISGNGESIHVAAGEAKAIDTTGAGDLWASGFLFGMLSGWTLERSAKLGSIVSNEVVQVVGAQIPEAGWARIREEMKNV